LGNKIYNSQKFVSKDVSDLKMEFGKMQSDLEHLKNDTATKIEFERWKADSADRKMTAVRWVIQLAIPVIVVLPAFFLDSRFE